MGIKFAKKTELLKRLDLTDIVLIVVDIRNPLGTLSTYLYKVTKNKKRIFVLNKADLVPKNVSELWEKWFYSKGLSAIAVSSTKRLGTLRLRKTLRSFSKDFHKEKVIAIVAGVPKTGKSSLINVLKGKRGSKVSAYPGSSGYTRTFTIFKIEGRLYVWDTPGVFPDVRDPVERAIRVTPPEKLKDPGRIAVKIIERVRSRFPGELSRVYKVDETLSPWSILEEISRKRGWIEKTTKEPLIDQAAIQIIRDYLEGKIKFYLIPKN